MTTKEATEFWYNFKPWQNKSLSVMAQSVVGKVGQLIDSNGTMKPRVRETLDFFKNRGYKIGLATNSPEFLISKVLIKLDIEQYFNAVSSSDVEANGKPSPDVYLTTARKLKVHLAKCIAFEYSQSGLKAALNAGMKAVAVPDKNQFYNSGFKTADLKLVA